MSTTNRILQYASNLLVCGTGVLYAAMRYFMEPADEWAVVNHPLQPQVQHLHVLVAPLLVFACGVIWQRHVVNHWKDETKLRRSGPTLAVVFLPMIVSGYLLQVSVAPGWRQAWVVLHVASSSLWTVAFVVHLAGALRRRRERGNGTVGVAGRETPLKLWIRGRRGIRVRRGCTRPTPATGESA